MKVRIWLKREIEKLKDPWRLLVNLAEFALVALAVITFAGERLIGISISHKIFWACLCLYSAYPIYRLIDHVMKTASDLKNGTWKGKK